MYVDPSGHFAISTLLIISAIITGVCVIGGATIGGISAGMSGGGVGDVFAGIGKGFLNGLIIGGGISLTIVGGLGFGVTSVLGSLMTTYGMSVVANMCEVGVLQAKKSQYDGDNFWNTFNDVNNAMYSNSGRILVGRLEEDGLVILGTRMFFKAWTLAGYFGQVNATAQYWKYSTAMSIVSKSFWTNKGNPVSLIFGYGLAGYQMYSFWNTLFSEPDFNNSKWILY